MSESKALLKGVRSLVVTGSVSVTIHDDGRITGADGLALRGRMLEVTPVARKESISSAITGSSCGIVAGGSSGVLSTMVMNGTRISVGADGVLDVCVKPSMRVRIGGKLFDHCGNQLGGEPSASERARETYLDLSSCSLDRITLNDGAHLRLACPRAIGDNLFVITNRSTWLLFEAGVYARLYAQANVRSRIAAAPGTAPDTVAFADADIMAADGATVSGFLVDVAKISCSNSTVRLHCIAKDKCLVSETGDSNVELIEHPTWPVPRRALARARRASRGARESAPPEKMRKTE